MSEHQPQSERDYTGADGRAYVHSERPPTDIDEIHTPLTDHDLLRRIAGELQAQNAYYLTHVRLFTGLAAVAVIVQALFIILWLLGVITIEFRPASRF